MAWIKQNLLFVGGCVFALALLAAAGFYDFQSLERNSKAKESLSEIYAQLNQLNQHKPSASDENTAAAREQESQLRKWLSQTKGYFTPIDPIPAPTGGEVKSEQFANALRRTIHDLQQESAASSVLLAPDYNFSFTAQRTLVRFAPGSPQLLSVQLGEVKAISEIFFAAHVNSLDGIQRLRVSDDDTAGPPSDYVELQAVTNEMAVMTPYEITFRAFGPEVAQVLAKFASSPHGFIVKAINVAPAEITAAAEAMPQPVAPVSARGGLQIMLDEKLLRVTVLVEVVKLKN